MLTSETITNIVPALLGAQASFKPAIKDAKNPHFRSAYVTLDGVLDAIREALLSHDIALLQQTDVAEDGRTILITRLQHVSGEWIASRYPVHPVKADPQGEGSALTYARRYALMALVGIAPEDDDGNAAVSAATRAAALSAVGNVKTTGDDPWADMDPEQRAFLERVVSKVQDHLRAEDGAAAAWDYLATERLDEAEKIAVWVRLESKQRSAIKKAEKAAKEKS